MKWWHNFNLKLFWVFLHTTGHTFNKDANILHIGTHKRLGVPTGVINTETLYYWWTADYFPPLIIWWNLGTLFPTVLSSVVTLLAFPNQQSKPEDSAFQVKFYSYNIFHNKLRGTLQQEAKWKMEKRNRTWKTWRNTEIINKINVLIQAVV